MYHDTRIVMFGACIKRQGALRRELPMMNEQQLKMILEGALLAAGRALTLDDLLGLFEDDERPERDAVRAALSALQEDYAERSFMLKEVASGFRLQVKRELSPWISRLWLERPSRYSRALLETLALVAYRQPITRGEIEDIRGVSVSSSIMKTLQERDWIRVVGHRDVPGKPAMYGTSKPFLDYFDLKSLDELPTLAELRDIDSINAELDLREPGDSADREARAATAELETDEPEGNHDEPASAAGEAVGEDAPEIEESLIEQDDDERSASAPAPIEEAPAAQADGDADAGDAITNETDDDQTEPADEDDRTAPQWRENG